MSGNSLPFLLKIPVLDERWGIWCCEKVDVTKVLKKVLVGRVDGLRFGKEVLVEKLWVRDVGLEIE